MFGVCGVVGTVANKQGIFLKSAEKKQWARRAEESRGYNKILSKNKGSGLKQTNVYNFLGVGGGVRNQAKGHMLREGEHITVKPHRGGWCPPCPSGAATTVRERDATWDEKTYIGLWVGKKTTH